MEQNVTTPRVSIVIPTFQRRALLEETLDSISAQTFPDWECIVVDDGSTDGSREMVAGKIASDNRFVWLEKPEGSPKGPAASRNLGLSASQGEFLHFFDSDDIMPPDHLENFLRLIEASDADYVVCRIHFFPDSHPHGAADTPILVEEDFIGRAIASEHVLFLQCVMWRRRLLAETAPMREDITMMEDLEFAVRAMLRTGAPVLANDLRVFVRRHDESLTFDPSPSRVVQRNLHYYDAYHAIVRSLAQAGYRSARAEAYCAKRRYDLLVEVLKLGYPSMAVARRHLHLLAWSILELRPRPIFRLGPIGPVFWLLAFARSTSRRFRPEGRR